MKLGAPHTWLTKQKVVDAGIAASLGIFGVLLLAGAAVHLLAPVATFTGPRAVAYRSSSEPAPPSRERPPFSRGSVLDREAMRSGSNSAPPPRAARRASANPRVTALGGRSAKALPHVARLARVTNSLPARGFTPRPRYPSARAERASRAPASHVSVTHAPTMAAAVGNSPTTHGSPAQGSSVKRSFAGKAGPRAAGVRIVAPAAAGRPALAAFRSRHRLTRQSYAVRAAVRRNGAHVVGARTPSRAALLRQRATLHRQRATLLRQRATLPPASNATPEPPLGYDRRLSFVVAPSEAAGVARADGIRVRGRPIPSAPPVSAAATPTPTR